MQGLVSRYKPVLEVIFLSLKGAFAAGCAAYFLGIPSLILPGVALAGFIFFSYIINRYTDTKEDFVNNAAKAVFFSKNKQFFWLGIAFVSCMIFFLLVNKQIHLYHFAVVSVGVIYSYRFFPWYWRGRGMVYVRFKDMPFIKNLVVALLWSSSVFAFPLLMSGPVVLSILDIWMLGLGLLVSSFINTLFDDIMDVKGDSFSNVKTIPTLLGEQWSLLILLILGIGWVIVVSMVWIFTGMNTGIAVFLFCFAFYPLAYIMPYKQRRLKPGAISIIMELHTVVFGAGLLVLKLINIGL